MKTPGRDAVVSYRCPECGALLDSRLQGEGICPACVAAVLLEEGGDLHGGGEPVGAAHDDGMRRPTIPGFTLLEPIGRGGMGVVYRARQDSPRREVAIKILSTSSVAISVEARRRFALEIELVGRLRHPGIVPIYESCLAKGGGIFYYVMELVDGVPLHRYCEEQRPRLSRDDTLKLFEKACRAVVYAHRQGVIHRDLTPANILVTVEGEPRLLDFGLGKALAAPDAPEPMLKVSLQGGILGSPSTMSPEQALGKPDVDTRSDVYSLGAILLYLLTSQWPHDQNGDLIDVLHRISKEPARVDRSMDPGLRAILERALATEPDHRYPSVETLADDVGRWRRREELSVRPLSWLRKVALWARRKPLAVAFAAVSVLLVLTLAIGGPLMALQQTRVRSAIEKRESARQRSLVRLLVHADAANVIEVYRAMEADLPAMAPFLREELANPRRPFGSDIRLKAALVASVPSLGPDLVQRLKHASEPIEACLLAYALRRQGHALALHFRSAVESGQLAPKSMLTFYHYVALAQWTPEDEVFWTTHAAAAVDATMNANRRRGGTPPLQLARLLKPAGRYLRPYLQQLPGGGDRVQREILAGLTDDAINHIVETAIAADDVFVANFPGLERDRVQTLAVLTGIYRQEVRRFRELPEDSLDRDRLGRVAVAMIRLDRDCDVWKQLGYSWAMRETLIEMLPRLGVSPELLHWKLRRANGMSRIDEGIRSGITRCFLQFQAEDLPFEMRDNILKRQREIIDGTVPSHEKEPIETARRLLEAWENPEADPHSQEGDER